MGYGSGKLYIMRHGKTEWNAERKLQGRTDIPLNAEGRQMARSAAKECADIPFDICFCSPLIRARQTAEIALEGRGVPIICDERLTEMGFGKYEGAPSGLVSPQGALKELFEAPSKYVPDGGAESLDSLFGRTGEFLKSEVLPRVKLGQSVLIVGHGAMNSSIICRIRDIPREKFWTALTDNCTLTRLI